MKKTKQSNIIKLSGLSGIPKEFINITGKFLNQTCHLNSKQCIGVYTLYESFYKWCISKGVVPPSKPMFVDLMLVKGFGKVKKKNRYIFHGLELI